VGASDYEVRSLTSLLRGQGARQMSKATKDLKDNVVFLKPELKLKKFVGAMVQYSTPVIVEAYSEEEAEQMIIDQEKELEVSEIDVIVNQLQ
jgi:hypothetical protein